MTATHALIDIGNVLLAFDFAPALKRLVPGASPEEASRRVEGLLARKDDFESGRIPEDEFIAWSSGVLQFTGTPQEFRDAWNDIFTPVDPMWKVISDFKSSGLTLILFSNTNAIHAPSFMRSYAVFEHFDHAVFSHEVGAMKPDPQIYHHAIKTHALDPARTLYIDDLQENIAEGNRHGLRSFQYDYRNHEALVDWLAAQE